MINPTVKKVSVALGEGVVVVRRVRRDGSQAAVVAGVLGTDQDGYGEVKVVWLDRIVHRPSDEFEGWKATGAVVTELHRV
jgi:hypothetical protein